MRGLTLRAALILVALVVLIPISALSVWQAVLNHNYTSELLNERLVIGALAMAERQRDEFIIAERTLLILSHNDDVRKMNLRCTEMLKPGLTPNSGVTNIVRTDAGGVVRCSIAPFKPGMSFAGEAWWQDGIERRAFSISAPLIGPIIKQEIVIGMLPIYSAQGKNDGAISIGIDFKHLQRSIANRMDLNNDRAGAIMLIQGQIVATSSKAMLPAFQPALANGRVAEATSRDGVVWRYSAAPVQDRGLHAIYAQPEHEIASWTTWLVWDNLAIPILAILCTALAIWIATKLLIVDWLASLTKLAGQFATGNYQGEAERYLSAPIEIAALSQSLHAMAGAIGHRDDELKGALHVKTQMTLEIHHRVKNNLQLVSSLLHLQMRRIGDPVAYASLDQARARISALAEIHRLLYEGGNDIEYGTVDVGRLLGQLCTQLHSLHRQEFNIELDYRFHDHVVAIDTAIPLSLFAVEAITNAYRYAFPDSRKGTIVLDYTVTDGKCRLRVADDGIGFDQDSVTLSMGSQLMSGFAHQLGGTFELTSDPGAGTEVILVFSTDRDPGAATPD